LPLQAAVGNAAPSTSRFGEFVLKDGYVLAPLTRRPPFDDQSKRALELLICDQEVILLALKKIKF
jgi:hypothetical protein